MVRRPVCLLVVVLLLASAWSPAGAQAPYRDVPGLPEGPAGAVIEALAAAVNAGTQQAVEQFLAQHATEDFRSFVPLAEHVEAFAGFRRQTQGVDVCCHRLYDPPRPAGEHVAILEDRLSGGWHAFVLRLEGERLAGLQFAPARPPSHLPPEPALSLEQALAELDRVVDRLAAAEIFAGAVLLARDGEVLYERAEGLASRGFGVANTPDTRFNLGSMNKMFTAVAIARLAAAEELSLDDTLDRYVDESWLPRETSARITLRQMLNHTSGLGSYFNETFWESSRLRFRALDDYKPLVRGETLAFDPGTDNQYSNTAFLLLGVVIEEVTGESYFDHVRAQVFEPAGMADTDSYELDRPLERLAIGYVQEPAPDGGTLWRNNLYMHVVKGGPAGGGFSTVRDLLRFDQALRSGALLAPEWRERLWTERPDDHAPRYGYGFSVEHGPAGKVVGHGGGFPGLNGQLDMYLDSGFTVAVLSNHDRGAEPVAEAAARLLGRLAD